MNQEFINRAKAAYDAWVVYDQGVASGTVDQRYQQLVMIAHELASVVGEGYQILASDAYEGVFVSSPLEGTGIDEPTLRGPNQIEQLIVDSQGALQAWSLIRDGVFPGDPGALLVVSGDLGGSLAGWLELAEALGAVESNFRGVENVIGEYPNNREVVEVAVLRLLESLEAVFNH